MRPPAALAVLSLRHLLIGDSRVPQVQPSSSVSFAMVTFTQELPNSCIRTLTLHEGSGTLSLSLKLHWLVLLL